MKIYLVGGAVRDELLGLPVKDRDWVVVGATVEDMLAQGYRQVGKDFPVFLNPETQEEYALARTERKQGKGYTGFVVHASPSVTLEEDLARRDLSINAIARDEQGQLIDPWGGVDDLQQRRLRHVSPAFVEDPLRVLRVARFAARFHAQGFQIADDTLALMWQMSQRGELAHLVSERVWQETSRALMSNAPSRYLLVLRQCGALRALFPEWQALFTVPLRCRDGREADLGLFTLDALDRAAATDLSLPERFALLCHGLGKADTSPQYWPEHPDPVPMGLKRLDTLCQRLRVPKDCQALAQLLIRHQQALFEAGSAAPETLLGLLEACDAFRRPERFHRLLNAGCVLWTLHHQSSPKSNCPPADTLHQALAQCQAVSPRPLLDQGFRGPALGEALRAARLSALATRY